MKNRLDDWAPEEIRLKEAFQKAYENDDRQPSKPLDLSFMEYDPERLKQAEMIKRLMLADEDFMNLILGIMELPPNVQLAIDDLVKACIERR